MDWTSAPITEDAPLEPAHRPFLPARISAVFQTIEAFLERERAQLPLWLVVAFGSGIAAWLILDDLWQWLAFILVALGLAATGATLGPSRIGRMLLLGGFAMAVGCALIWWRSDRVAAPRLHRPVVATFEARVERVELRAAKGDLRLTLSPSGTELPPILRVSLSERNAPSGLGTGAVVRIRSRIQPPPPIGSARKP